VRTVLKRLKGTKIPTMTAAGLQLQPIVDPPTFGPPTINELSQQVTDPSVQPEPLPPLDRTPARAAPIPPGGVTTLAGHSMPPRPKRAPILIANRPSVPPGNALGPIGPPTAASLVPPGEAEPLRQPASRRWLVIAIVAVVASAIGITVAMLA
jgi:hypothetical protein